MPTSAHTAPHQSPPFPDLKDSAVPQKVAQVTMGRRKSRGRKLIPTVEGDKVIAERFRTKLCRNYLQHPDCPCPYEDRCMFAHGDHELRTAAQNLEDGLVSEDAIRLFKQKRLVTSDEFSQNRTPPQTDFFAFSSSASLESPLTSPTKRYIAANSSNLSLTIGGRIGAAPRPSSVSEQRLNQVPFAYPATRPLYLHFEVSSVGKEMDDDNPRSSKISSPSSDRRSHRGSSVVSEGTTEGTTEGTPTLTVLERFSLNSQVSRSLELDYHRQCSGIEQMPSPGPSGSSIDSGVVFKYRHDPYGWRAI
jgi:hypothetical protein